MQRVGRKKGKLMRKMILYRLFSCGFAAEKLLPVLEQEGGVVLDQGMGGWFVPKHRILPVNYQAGFTPLGANLTRIPAAS
jgi:hypothetical protein